jgi:hypothetical protein
LTRAQIAEAKARGVQPSRTGGFGYLQGPENALVEYAGNHPAERFNHVHMFQEHPYCAQLWYQKHLEAPVFAGRMPRTPLSESDCQVPRGPDRSWPALERDRPLVTTRGQLYDHIALSVTDLDAWVTKLRREGVRFLEEPYKLGETRAVMIEGPSREALELVEVG